MSDEEMEEKNEMVTLVVTIDKELLRMVDPSLQPNFGTEGIATVEEGLNFITNNEPEEADQKPPSEESTLVNGM